MVKSVRGKSIYANIIIHFLLKYYPLSTIIWYINMVHYSRISTCVTYQAYEFKIGKLSQPHYTKLKNLVQTLGENIYPSHLGVLHICHKFFFLDFPSKGFPIFKISFYSWTPPEQIEYYLKLLNEYI